ncbi:MAG: hypothetical protein I8H96_01735 [Sphingomonadaceae bacterium]|nr:hypothetical protein [Sphingomonadaceae bacterium]
MTTLFRAYGNRVLAGVTGIAIIALFARIMSFPVRHDEQMYVPVGMLLRHGDLYRDFGFNNLPNLALLLGLSVELTGTDHYLLAGRLVIFAAWLLALVAMGLLVFRASRSLTASLLAALLIVTNPVLIGPAGMLATNNFLPLPFALAATALLIAGLDRSAPRPWLIAGAGVCVGIAAGFKANYAYLIPLFGVTALMVPWRSGWRIWALRSIVPLALGGIVGSLPVLYYLLRDPHGFLVHVVHYHRGPHIAYWMANLSLDGEKIMTFPGKVALAAKVWIGGGVGFIFATAAVLGWMAMRDHNARRDAPRRAAWPIWLLIAIIAGGIFMSFVPTPSFPQYYVPPIPFVIALAAMLYGRLGSARQTVIAPYLLVAAAGVALWGMPRLVIKLPQLAHPAEWAGNIVHAAGVKLADHVRANDVSGPVATLAPLYPMEGGLPLYTELTAGPLVYRVGDLIPAEDRPYYRLISPTSIGRLLESQPPAAILVGQEGDLDAPFLAYARQHGYRLVEPELVNDRYGKASLYLRPVEKR